MCDGVQVKKCRRCHWTRAHVTTLRRVPVNRPDTDFIALCLARRVCCVQCEHVLSENRAKSVTRNIRGICTGPEHFYRAHIIIQSKE
jgi:hypothetical protein